MRSYVTRLTQTNPKRLTEIKEGGPHLLTFVYQVHNYIFVRVMNSLIPLE